jgi:uncharacterized membrane protein
MRELISGFRDVMEVVGVAIDGAGVLIVVVGASISTFRYLFNRQGTLRRSYTLYRQETGHAILLGIEFMVAGDIIRTVVVDPTLENVIVLGLIVLIRTVLSFALHLEVEGKWPWERGEEAQAPNHRD